MDFLEENLRPRAWGLESGIYVVVVSGFLRKFFSFGVE
jgi:hypothetical protein